MVTGAAWLLLVMPAGADQAFLASAQLRGGFDANPTLAPGSGHGSGFVTAGAAFAAGKGDDDARLGIVGEFQHTEYATREVDPADHMKLRLEAEHVVHAGWHLRGSSSVEQTHTYDLQAFNAVQTVKLRQERGAFRPFLTAELGYSTLNESNVIYGDFLPEPERFVRAGVTVGLALGPDDRRVGVSVSASSIRYPENSDPFGFDRDNRRIEPFLFFNFKEQGFDFNGSVSRLNGAWDDRQIIGVSQTLYDVSLSKAFGDFKVAVVARRSAEETTFPYVPVTIASTRSATVSYAVTPALTLRATVKALRSDYLGLPLSSTTDLIGIGATYRWSDNWTLALEASRITGTLIDGEAVSGGVFTVALSKAFRFLGDQSAVPSQWTALPPSTGQQAARGWGPLAPPPSHQP